MTRTVPTSVAGFVAAVENRPVELYEVYLDTGTLFYAQANDYVVFGAQTYSPIGIARAPVRTSVEMTVDEVEVRIDNVDLTQAKNIIATDFVGRRLVVKKAFREALTSSGDYIGIFDGRMDEPVLTQTQLSVRVRSHLDALHQYVPRRLFSSACNYQHYDAACTVSKTVGTNLTTGTAIGSSTATALVASVLSGYADAWWGPIGNLKMNTGSNAGLGREVLNSSQSSNSVSTRVAFPYAINSGEVFTLTRGCRKTTLDCTSKYNNFVNFGGYHVIPKTPLF